MLCLTFDTCTTSQNDKTMNKPSGRHGSYFGINPGNAEYIDQLYEAFKDSPDLVSPEWRHYFYGFEYGAGEAAPSLLSPKAGRPKRQKASRWLATRTTPPARCL